MSSRLTARLDRLQPHAARRMVVFREHGDTDLDIAAKVTAAGCPVAVMPRPCKTAEEWLALYGPAGVGRQQ